MANSKAGRKSNPLDLANLSERDRDILTLDVPGTMKKYKMEKQGVYDRRFALNKKIKAAGLTVEQVLNKVANEDVEAAPKKVQPKKAKAKKTAQKQVKSPVIESQASNREEMLADKAIPVIMKPVEINFGTFSIKLNGVPRSMSVNPDTNAIEIDF